MHVDNKFFSTWVNFTYTHIYVFIGGRGVPFYPSESIGLLLVFAINKGAWGKERGWRNLTYISVISSLSVQLCSNFCPTALSVSGSSSSLQSCYGKVTPSLKGSGSVLAHLGHSGQKGFERGGSFPHVPNHASFPVLTAVQRTPTHPPEWGQRMD